MENHTGAAGQPPIPVGLPSSYRLLCETKQKASLRSLAGDQARL
jgi:hypothetical protein